MCVRDARRIFCAATGRDCYRGAGNRCFQQATNRADGSNSLEMLCSRRGDSEHAAIPCSIRRLQHCQHQRRPVRKGKKREPVSGLRRKPRNIGHRAISNRCGGVFEDPTQREANRREDGRWRQRRDGWCGGSARRRQSHWGRSGGSRVSDTTTDASRDVANALLRAAKHSSFRTMR